jgi:hypothetical protein
MFHASSFFVLFLTTVVIPYITKRIKCQWQCAQDAKTVCIIQAKTHISLLFFTNIFSDKEAGCGGKRHEDI